MDKEEALKLYLALAREHGKCANMFWHTDFLIWLTKTLKPKVIVDLGTYCGGSFWCWLYGLVETDSNGHVYTVDIIDRSEKLLAAKPHSNLFTHIVGDGKKVDIPAEYIDFLFIDDDHSYEQVMSEWEKHEAKVNIGGLIFFHDVRLVEPDGKPCGVPKALRELWQKHKDRFVRLLNLGTLIGGDPCGLEIWIKLR